MSFEEGECIVEGVIWAHTVMITIKVGDILFWTTTPVSFKVLLRMTHRNKLVFDCVKEESRNGALSC